MSPFTYKSLGALDRVGEGMKRESKARHSVWHPVWPINSYCYCCYCYCPGGRSPWEEPDAGPSAWAPSSAPTGPVIPSCAPASQNSQGLSERARPLRTQTPHSGAWTAPQHPSTRPPCYSTPLPKPARSPPPATAPPQPCEPRHPPVPASASESKVLCPHCQSVSNSRTKTGPLLPLCPQHPAQGLAGSGTEQMFAE